MKLSVEDFANARSATVKSRQTVGLGCRTISCCRSSTFSAARADWLAKNTLKNTRIIRKTP